MIVFMIVLISCSVHDNEDGKTNGNFGVIKKKSLILEYGRDSVERPPCFTLTFLPAAGRVSLQGGVPRHQHTRGQNAEGEGRSAKEVRNIFNKSDC